MNKIFLYFFLIIQTVVFSSLAEAADKPKREREDYSALSEPSEMKKHCVQDLSSDSVGGSDSMEIEHGYSYEDDNQGKHPMHLFTQEMWQLATRDEKLNSALYQFVANFAIKHPDFQSALCGILMPHNNPHPEIREAQTIVEKNIVDENNLEKTLGGLTDEHKIKIFTFAANNTETDPRNLRLVCKEWRKIINGLKKEKDQRYADQHPIWQKLIRVAHVGLGNDNFWKTFLEGELVYNSKLPSGINNRDFMGEDGKKRDQTLDKYFKICDLPNPFAGSFELGTIDEGINKKLTISIGLHKDRNTKVDPDVIEINLVPRDLIPRILAEIRSQNRDTSNLQDFMEDWNEEWPMAVFINGGNWCYCSYSYSIYEGLASISQRNLVRFVNDQRAILKGEMGMAVYPVYCTKDDEEFFKKIKDSGAKYFMFRFNSVEDNTYKGLKKEADAQKEGSRIKESRGINRGTLGNIVSENKVQIFTLAVSDENTDPNNLRLVCKEWKDIIDKLQTDKKLSYKDQHPIWQKLMRVYYCGLGNDALWETFLNGELVVYQQPFHDIFDEINSENEYDEDDILKQNEVKSFKISDLPNPFGGSFDLSTLEKKYTENLRVSIGLNKRGKKDYTRLNTRDWILEISLVPRMLAERSQRPGNVPFLQELMGEWKKDCLVATIYKEVGWCTCSYFYGLHKDLKSISKKGLGNTLFDNHTKKNGVKGMARIFDCNEVEYDFWDGVANTPAEYFAFRF